MRNEMKELVALLWEWAMNGGMVEKRSWQMTLDDGRLDIMLRAQRPGRKLRNCYRVIPLKRLSLERFGGGLVHLVQQAMEEIDRVPNDA